ncbi:MAG: 50S ribosomal protein L3 N(5)-glutamine methyltransferase [Gammaproteobacteria bacterium]|nr:50S ribosomal protein L3 N(5)-glutamine methyltransferase [Gammaproteobacteria bacterium]
MPITKEITEELHSIRDFMRWAMTQFYQAEVHFGHGTDNAWDEAAILLAHTLHLPPTVNQEVLDAHLTKEEKYKIIELIERRIYERIPAAYLTHEAWFTELPFYVDNRVLIPRSSLGELILKQFEPWVRPASVKRILDLGTGSGCIAIACALAFPEATVDATDISQDALDVAKLNVEKHKVSDQVKLIKSDVFASLSDKIYDIIISNPPYVASAEIDGLPAEYAHEPKMALAAGKEGLDIVTRILRTAKNHLSNDGILIVEVGNSENAVIERFPHLPFTWIEFEKGEGGVFLITKEQLTNEIF